MSEWLDTTGLSSYGIGICDRCRRKRPIVCLGPDPNAPGLRVCIDDGDHSCADEFDPYRLPARQSEVISLPFTRPDVPLTDDDEDLSFYYIITESGIPIETESGDELIIEAAP